MLRQNKQGPNLNIWFTTLEYPTQVCVSHAQLEDLIFKLGLPT
jgi:hypothetical protein